MTQSDPVPTLQRWTLPILASMLTLGLLVLTLLDYAISADSSIVIAACLFLLVLLSILVIRLLAQTRQPAATLQVSPISQVTPSAASRLLLGLTLLAMFLRLFQLGAESFWYDETWTALFSSRPASAILRGVNPLPHMVAHLSLWLGRSEFILRLGPALAGVLLIPATYLLGRTLYRRIEGLTAAGILTVSLYAIYHSQDLRFYSWQMLFSTLTLAFLLRGLTHRRWHDWVGFAVATALNLYTHPFALFALASEGLYALAVAVADSVATHKGLPVGDHRRYLAAFRFLAPLALCALAALVAFGPGWTHLSALTNDPDWSTGSEFASTGMQRSSWLVTPIATWTYELPSSLLALTHPALLAAFFAIFFVGLLSSSRRRAALVLLWFLVPPVILFFARVRFYHRYLSYFLPLFMIVVAHGIHYIGSMLRGRRQRLLAVALLAALAAAPSLAQLPDYYQGTQKTQWRETISFIEANHQPGDVVLVTLNSILGAPVQPFDWYRTVPSTELPWQYFPKDGTLADPTQLGELPAITQHYRRAWFILPMGSSEIENGISTRLSGHFLPVEKLDFGHLEVLLYRAISPGEAP